METHEKHEQHEHKTPYGKLIALTITFIAMYFLMYAMAGSTANVDKQFLKSMIPHRAAAMLMVKETTPEDPEIQKSAERIIAAQQEEIKFMRTKLKQPEEK